MPALSLSQLPERFADVPDKMPDYNDTNAFSKYAAVKKLLRALFDDGLMAAAADAAFAQFVESLRGIGD